MNNTESHPPLRLPRLISLQCDRFLALESDVYTRGKHVLLGESDIANAETRSIESTVSG